MSRDTNGIAHGDMMLEEIGAAFQRATTSD